jgi:tetratricopeptide (TPR) repeat protein
MQSGDSIYQLSQIISNSSASLVVAAFRQDPIIWASLENQAFFQKVVALAGDNVELWMPAGIAMIALSENGIIARDLSENLNHSPGIDLQNSSWEQFSAIKQQPKIPESIQQAGLLALGLREYRQRTGSWTNICQELSVGDKFDDEEKSNEYLVFNLWRTPLTCLFGLIPDREDLLSNLIKFDDINLTSKWITHILLSNILSRQEREDLFYAQMHNLSTRHQTAWLRRLNIQGNSDLVMKLSDRLLPDEYSSNVLERDQGGKSLQEISGASQIISKAAALQDVGSLYQFAQHPKHASQVLEDALEIAEQWVAGIKMQLSDVVCSRQEPISVDNDEMSKTYDGNDISSISPEFIVANINRMKDCVIQKNILDGHHHAPFLLIARAEVAANEGDLRLAKTYAQEAMSVLDEIQSLGIGLFSPMFAVDWRPTEFVTVLRELDMPHEALECALMILEGRPIDIDLIDLICQILVDIEDFQEAEKYARLEGLIAPDNPSGHRRLAALWDKQGNWENAFEERKQVLTTSDHPEMADWLALAAAALAINQPGITKEACEIVIESNEHQAEAYDLIGRAYYAMEDVDKAIECLEFATSENAQAEKSWTFLAKLHRYGGDTKLAMNILRRAFGSVPESYDVTYELSKACLDSGLYTDALTYAHKALAMQDSSLKAVILLGEVLYSLGNFEDGRHLLAQSWDMGQRDPELAYWYGKYLLDANEIQAALPVLEIAMEIEPPQIDRYSLYVETLLGEESLIYGDQSAVRDIDINNGLEVIQEGLGFNAGDYHARLLLAELCRLNGEYARAYKLFKVLRGELKTSSSKYWQRTYTGLGRTALDLKEIENAVTALEENIHRNSNDYLSNRLLAEAYSEAGLTDSAKETAEKVLDLKSEDPATVIWFSKMVAEQGEHTAAIEALDIHVKKYPTNITPKIHLAEMHLNAGDVDTAKLVLERILILDGISPEDYRLCAKLYQRIDEYHLALDCFESAYITIQKTHPETGSCVDVRIEIVDLHMKMGNFDRAIDELKTQINKTPEDISLHILLSDVLSHINRCEDALASLEKVKKLIDEQLGTKVDCRWVREGQDGKPLVIRLVSGVRTADIDLRYALVLRKMEQYPLALQYAEQAFIEDSDSLASRYLALNLKSTLLLEEPISEPSGMSISSDILADWELTDEDKRVAVNRKPGWESIILLQGYFIDKAFEQRDIPKSIELIGEGLELFAQHPRFLFANARAAANIGDWIEAAEYYEKADELAREQWEDAPQELGNLFNPNPLADEFAKKWKLWAADAAYDTRNWDSVVNTFDSYIEENLREPRTYLSYARALVRMAEEEHLCESIHCVRNNPGLDKLQQNKYQRFQAAIRASMKLTSSEILAEWHIRGEAAFDPTETNIQTLQAMSNQSKNRDMVLVGMSDKDTCESYLLGPVDIYSDPITLMRFVISCQTGLQNACVEYTSLALNAWPKDPRWHTLLAVLLQSAGDTESASKALEEALHIWPDEPEWHAWAARLSEEMGEYESVLSHREEAASLEPLSAGYALALGKAYLLHEDLPSAIDVLEIARQLDKDHPETWLVLSDAYLGLDQQERALECVEKASLLDEDSIEPILKAGEISLKSGDLDVALNFARRAYEDHSDDPQAVLFLSRVLVEMGNLESGLSILEEYKSDAPLSIKKKHAFLVDKLKGAKAALPIYEAMVEEYPEDIETLQALVFLQSSCGQPDEAIKTAKASLRLQPEQPTLNLFAGRYYRQTGHLDQAISHFIDALRQEPDKLDLYVELAETHRQRREDRLALDVYLKAVEALPEDHQAYCLTAELMKEAKDYPGAEKMLRSAAKVAPDDVKIRRQLSAVMALNLVHSP